MTLHSCAAAAELVTSSGSVGCQTNQRQHRRLDLREVCGRSRHHAALSRSNSAVIGVDGQFPDLGAGTAT